MHHRIVILLLLYLIAPQLNAQDPVKYLELWKQQHPKEKVYLHLDRDRYKVRDTVWFKAYLNHDYLPDTLSTILYAEIWSSEGKQCGQQVLPVIFGTSYGQFELPDSCKPGEYMIRAWTPLMLNQQETCQQFFRIEKVIHDAKTNANFATGTANAATVTLTNASVLKTVTPNSSGLSVVNTSRPSPVAVSVQFFPEGGNLIGGVVNTVAFQLKDANGLLTNGRGILTDETGKELLTFKTIQQGRGVFEWTPEYSKKYYATLEGGYTNVALPEVQRDGIAMSLIPHPQGWFFELRAGTDNAVFRPAYMVGQMQQEVVFRTELNGNKKGWQGLLNTTHLRSGIMQVTLFNKDHMPLAERLCFVDNGEYKTTVKLHTDTISFQAHAFNYWKLQLLDTIRGSLSVSVTDATNDGALPARNNILSSFLLSADWPDAVADPAWYFRTDADSSAAGLDLLMMTSGWRRFHWETINSDLKKTNTVTDPRYISMEGTVLLKGTRKPFANKDLLVIMGAMGKGRNLFMTKTDEKGRFILDSMLFSGNVRFYFMEPRGKKSQYIEVHISHDTIPVFAAPFPLSWQPNPEAVVVTASNGYDTHNIDKEEGTLLEGVTVEAHRKSPEQLVDERYTSGAFSGFASKTFDLVSGDQMITEPTIFDYLVARVPGLSFTNDGPEYILYYRQAPSVSSMGPIPMTVFLNEVETDASIIATIPPNDIALVKIYSTFVGAFGNGAGGALAIYTKKGADMTKAAARGDVVTYRGFTIRREFLSTDYRSMAGSFVKADRRKTLDWRPNIFVNHVNPSIPVRFYNNDGAKAYRIRVEGMTYEGKLISFEQIIHSDKP